MCGLPSALNEYDDPAPHVGDVAPIEPDQPRNVEPDLVGVVLLK